MIEQGLVKLVQGNAGVLALCKSGGFDSELPKDFSLPTWIYTIVYDHSDPTLLSFKTLNRFCIQIDCFGKTAGEALTLAKTISGVLDGFRGTLADDDSCWIDCCFSTDRQNFFEDAPRNYRRMIEFTAMYSTGIVASPPAGVGVTTPVTVPVTVGPSPFTYGAGEGFETVYISGGSSTQVSRHGIPITDALPITVFLQPLETVTVTYTEAPTIVVDK